MLLQKGRAMTLGDVGRYVGGGINGSPLSAVNQFEKTLGMRFGFCSVELVLESAARVSEYGRRRGGRLSGARY